MADSAFGGIPGAWDLIFHGTFECLLGVAVGRAAEFLAPKYDPEMSSLRLLGEGLIQILLTVMVSLQIASYVYGGRTLQLGLQSVVLGFFLFSTQHHMKAKMSAAIDRVESYLYGMMSFKSPTTASAADPLDAGDS